MWSSEVSTSLMRLTELHPACNYLQLTVNRRARATVSGVMRKPLPRVLCNKNVKQGASMNGPSVGHPSLLPTAPQHLLSSVSLAQRRGLSFCFWSQDLSFKWKKERARLVCSIYSYFLNYFTYFHFIFGCAGPSLPCRLFSSCGEHGWSLAVVHGLLWSRWLVPLQSAVSRVHRLQ